MKVTLKCVAVDQTVLVFKDPATTKMLKRVKMTVQYTGAPGSASNQTGEVWMVLPAEDTQDLTCVPGSTYTISMANA